MKLTKRSETGVRTLVFSVEDVPDLDITAPQQRKPVVIRPRRLSIVVVDGKTSAITVTGPLILKSGAASENTVKTARYYPWSDREAPDWVREACRDVLAQG